MSIRLQLLREAWDFLRTFTGRAGEVVVDTTNNRLVVHDGATAGGFPAAKLSDLTAPQNLTRLGIGTTADAATPFAAKLDAALWTALTKAEGGSGDLRYTLNKEAAGNTLSVLFQSGWSGRAEIGLSGDDDLHLKVSSDGTAWTEALRIDRKTAAVTVPGPLVGAAATLTNLALSGTPDQLVINGGGNFASIAFTDGSLSSKWSFGRDPGGALMVYDAVGGRNPIVLAPNGPVAFSAPITARSASFGGALGLGSFTVATLPAGSAGEAVFVSDGRKVLEGAGSGTGVMACYSNGAWRRLSDDAAVTG